MLTIEELRAEVYRRHHKRLTADDPIFMTVTMHELLLAHYLEQCRVMQEAQMEEIRKNSMAVIDECEKISIALINRSMTVMQQNYEAKEKAFLNRIEQTGNAVIIKLESLLLHSERIKQKRFLIQVCVCSFVVVICLLLILMGTIVLK